MQYSAQPRGMRMVCCSSPRRTMRLPSASSDMYWKIKRPVLGASGGPEVAPGGSGAARRWATATAGLVGAASAALGRCCGRHNPHENGEGLASPHHHCSVCPRGGR